MPVRVQELEQMASITVPRICCNFVPTEVGIFYVFFCFPLPTFKACDNNSARPKSCMMCAWVPRPWYYRDIGGPKKGEVVTTLALWPREKTQGTATRWTFKLKHLDKSCCCRLHLSNEFVGTHFLIFFAWPSQIHLMTLVRSSKCFLFNFVISTPAMHSYL